LRFCISTIRGRDEAKRKVEEAQNSNAEELNRKLTIKWADKERRIKREELIHH
jgi:hypothetical protein